MEQEHPSGPEFTEIDEIKEKDKVPIDKLPEALGFVETEELGQLRAQLLGAMAAGDDVKELAIRYHLLAGEVINQLKDDGFVRAQIGLIIQMGLIRRDGGRADFLEDLRDAWTYADNARFTDLAQTLEAAAEELASLSLAIACKEVISTEDCEELKAMPFDEALGYAFTLLLDTGINPDSFLIAQGVLEPPG